MVFKKAGWPLPLRIFLLELFFSNLWLNKLNSLPENEGFYINFGNLLFKVETGYIYLRLYIGLKLECS